MPTILPQLRIALIGRFGATPDEGMRKLCLQYETAVRQAQTVLTIQTRDFCSGRAWSVLRKFRPHCLHYLTGPTIFSLMALRAHALSLPSRPVTLASGIRPYLGKTGRALAWAIAPDRYLAQARRWQRLFKDAGSETIDFPNGVDTGYFRPASPDRRRELQAQWGLPPGKPIVLHVGHVKENRNLDSLLEVQQSGRYQVWIVGSKSESRPGPGLDRLLKAGCLVHTEYVPSIAEVYQAADAYVFTVRSIPAGNFPRHYQEVGVIDFPLSVLEAMACGLPVITTRHDALEYFIGSTTGVYFYDGTGQDALRELDGLDGKPCATRVAAEGFDLDLVMGRLGGIYSQAVGKTRTT